MDSVIWRKFCDEVTIIGIWKENLPLEEEVHSLCKIIRIFVSTRLLSSNLLFSCLKYFEWSFKVFLFVSRNKITLIHAHSLKSLPIAVFTKLLFGPSLIYDAHELETESNGLKGGLKILCQVFERLLIKFPDQVITVSDLIAENYQKKYPHTNPIVIRNIPRRTIEDPRKTNLRKSFNIPKRDLLFLYLGGLIEGRGVELILESFACDSDGKHLVFIGSGKLEKKIRSTTGLKENIYLHAPVPPNEVINYAKEADVGLCLIEDLCLSYRFSLPNKLFEYLVSGIPVIMNDLPEQRKFVEKYDCGWVLSNPQSELSGFLKDLSLKEVSKKKKGVDQLRNELNWDEEIKPYLHFIERIFSLN